MPLPPHCIHTQVRGLHKSLSRVDTKSSDVYAKETFEGHFSVLDVIGVCRYGEYISDVVVYDFAKFFTCGRKDLYVESPAVIHTMVDVTTMQVNKENVAHFMVKNSENLSWWQRLQKGWYPMYTPSTPKCTQVHPSAP